MVKPVNAMLRRLVSRPWHLFLPPRVALQAVARSTLSDSASDASLARRRAKNPPDAASDDDDRRRGAIAIVGGGPTGLAMALLLARYEVPSRVLERLSPASRFRHPQAHFLNTRTMELLRYWLPEVYEDVLKAMPPVHQWESFRFGYDMSQDPPLAIVRHPVRRPLVARRDANGSLIGGGAEAPLPDPPAEDSSAQLSPCTVGHLAQHTFGRILYERALQQPEFVQLHYGTTVTDVELRPNGALVRARPSSPGSGAAPLNPPELSTPLCVAADGARSTVRRRLGIDQTGAPGLQHLINVHVSLPLEQAEALHAKGNHAMLYSVFHQEIVAMVVCHSLGEYVVQIPYFPPYQTPEYDFSEKRMRELLAAVFGPRVQRDSWTIESIHPWTMSALVSNRYYSGRAALVGDAAHVFPPAGGLGMNTGIQDAHNLAWRLAEAYHEKRLGDSAAVEHLLQAYQDDRRAVAQHNAALSARNYRRLLQVTKACYLNERHPALLVQLLDAMPAPLAIRQAVFRQSFKAALAPLTGLRNPSQSWYGRHVSANLRRVLESGAGLPLLFPEHELGFRYGGSSSSSGGGDAASEAGATDGAARPSLHPGPSDTWAGAPTLRVGGLVPHVTVHVDRSSASHHPRLRPLGVPPSSPPGEDRASFVVISTTNLPAQLSGASGEEDDSRPAAVLLVVASHEEVSAAEAKIVSKSLAADFSWPVVVARILPQSETPLSDSETSPSSSAIAIDLHKDEDGGQEENRLPTPPELVLHERPSAFSFWANRPSSGPYHVLVRPDGHVERVW